jgi:N-carbamoyl-L-amino-acid hydrolase
MAGHDAQVVGRVAPAGMIFVPSQDGRSHSPLEFTADEDVERGANVLLLTLLKLAAE